MKLWLDDVRPAPPGWTWVATVDGAIAGLRLGGVTEISLDYDLDYTDGDRKGLEVMEWIERNVKALKPFPVIHWHTANPRGGQEFARVWRRIEMRHGIPWLA